jgi:hypothetical protein
MCAKSAHKMEKGAATWWPPLLEIEIIPSRLSHLTCVMFAGIGKQAHWHIFGAAAELEYVLHCSFNPKPGARIFQVPIC